MHWRYREKHVSFCPIGQCFVLPDVDLSIQMARLLYFVCLHPWRYWYCNIEKDQPKQNKLMSLKRLRRHAFLNAGWWYFSDHKKSLNQITIPGAPVLFLGYQS